ncbi:MAG: hypothetical protein HQK78_19725, partial [Desulfobacterales bacterium]|nr:hypothetical protein [Desulfobacterales bacterium]
KTKDTIKGKKVKGDTVESAVDNDVIINTERIDDYVLLINVMINAGLPDIINGHIEHHGLHQGLSFGWLATIWLSHILSQGDHRKVTVRDWVKQSQNTLEKVTGLKIRETDFTDDRLTLLLEKVSKIEIWKAIESELNRVQFVVLKNLEIKLLFNKDADLKMPIYPPLFNKANCTQLNRITIRVYDLEPKKVRIDTTTVSGYHEGGEDSLLQYGHSKDEPSLKQIKVLIASLDPLGMPLITEVLSGEKADDRLYVPAVDRIIKNIDKKGLLFIGDCKMSAVDTRGHIHNSGHHYLMPLSMVGNNRDKAEDWIKDALGKENEVIRIYVTDHKGPLFKTLKRGFAAGCLTVSYQCLSWMKGNFHVQFLGGFGLATAYDYPTQP